MLWTAVVSSLTPARPSYPSVTRHRPAPVTPRLAEVGSPPARHLCVLCEATAGATRRGLCWGRWRRKKERKKPRLCLTHPQPSDGLLRYRRSSRAPNTKTNRIYLSADRCGPRHPSPAPRRLCPKRPLQRPPGGPPAPLRNPAGSRRRRQRPAGTAPLPSAPTGAASPPPPSPDPPRPPGPRTPPPGHATEESGDGETGGGGRGRGGGAAKPPPPHPAPRAPGWGDDGGLAVGLAGSDANHAQSRPITRGARAAAVAAVAVGAGKGGRERASDRCTGGLGAPRGLRQGSAAAGCGCGCGGGLWLWWRR